MDLRTLCSNGNIVHKNKMFNLYMDQKLVDIELILSDGSIKVHSIVLASESKVAFKLMKLLPGSSRTLKWTQYSKEVMRFVVEFIYKGTVIYPRHLESQINSLTKFLQLNGVSIENKHTSTKHETKSFGKTHNFITNIKPEDEVIEISDESFSENEIKSGDNVESVHTGSSQSVLIDSKNEHSSKINCKTNCRIVEESFSQHVFIPPEENDSAITNKQLEANNTNDSTFLSLTSDTFLSIPPEENDFVIPNKPLEANNTSPFLSPTSDTFLSMPPEENDFIIPNKPLEANNTSTFLSLTSDTFLSISPEENDIIPNKSLDTNNTLTSDTFLSVPAEENDFHCKSLEGDNTITFLSPTSEPNLRSNKNPYAKMIKKKVHAKKKIFNFLKEPNDRLIQDVLVEEHPPAKMVEDILRDLQVDTTEEFTRNATNQNVPNKISIISHHLITTSDQENVLTSRKRKRAMIGTKIK